jgi:hypothetical protein
MKKLLFTKKHLENSFEDGYDNRLDFNEYFETFSKNIAPKEYFEKEDVLKILINFEKDRDWSGIKNWLDEYILENSPKVEEEKVPITYGTIKNTCGWYKWCDITHMNHFVMEEWGEFEDNHILYCKKSQFQKLF